MLKRRIWRLRASMMIDGNQEQNTLGKSDGINVGGDK
jgi:hypothetical protein